MYKTLAKMFVTFFIISVLSLIAGVVIGREWAFDDISSERCWLEVDSRDIECIQYVKNKPYKGVTKQECEVITHVNL